MKIKKIEAENFWSFRKLSFDFENYLYLIEGQNHDEGSANAAGKSGFLNSLSYLLFGEIPKKAKLDDMSFNSEGGMQVKGIIEGNFGEIEITRGRKPSIFQISHNGKDLTGSDQKDLQNKLEKIMGVNFDIFVNSAYFHQNSLRDFFKCSDTTKKEIFTELLDLKAFDLITENCKKEISQLKEKILRTEVDIQNTDKIIQLKSKDVQDLQERVDHFDKLKKEDLSKNSIEILKLEAKKKEALEEISVLKGKSVETNEVLALEVQALKDKVSLIQSKKNEFSSQSRFLSQKIASFNKEKEHLVSLKKSECPTCFQPVSLAIIGKMISDIELKVSEEQGQLDIVKKSLSTLEEGEKSVSAVLRTKVEENDVFLTAKREYETSLRLKNQLISHLDEDIKKSTDNYEKIKNRENSFLVLKDQSEKEIANFIKEKQNKEEELCSNKEVILYSIFLEEMFGPKGLKSFVFTKLLNELTARTNKYLSMLFDENVSIIFKSDTEMASGKIAQKIDTIVMRNNKEFPVDNFSGGEERRVVFATNLALSDIVANRNKSPLSFAIFDEVFDGMDKTGKEKAIQILKDIKKNRDLILVIDHSSEAKMQFDQVIKIEKRKGESSICRT